MKKKKFEPYVKYILDLVKSEALELREETIDSEEVKSLDYNKGALMAYSEVLTLMKNQASYCGVRSDDVSLDDIEPGRDLKVDLGRFDEK